MQTIEIMHEILAFLLISLLNAQAKPPDTWGIFARVKFSSKFFKKLNQTFSSAFDSKSKGYQENKFHS